MSVIDPCLFLLAEKDNLHHSPSYGFISAVPGTLETQTFSAWNYLHLIRNQEAVDSDRQRRLMDLVRKCWSVWQAMLVTHLQPSSCQRFLDIVTEKDTSKVVLCMFMESNMKENTEALIWKSTAWTMENDCMGWLDADSLVLKEMEKGNQCYIWKSGLCIQGI